MIAFLKESMFLGRFRPALGTVKHFEAVRVHAPEPKENAGICGPTPGHRPPEVAQNNTLCSHRICETASSAQQTRK